LNLLALTQLRISAARALSVLLWLHLPVIALVAWLNGMSPWVPLAIAAVLSAAAALAVRRDAGSLATRYILTTALIAMPMLIVEVGMGVWQVDYHLYFFAVFAMLVAFVDWRPIVLAAGLTAVHHIAMAFLMPMGVFPDQSGFAALPRCLLHAGIVVVECGVLILITNRVAKLFAIAASEQARAEQALENAEALRAELIDEGAAKALALTEAREALTTRAQLEDSARIEERRAREGRLAAETREAAVRRAAASLDAAISAVSTDLARAAESMLHAAQDTGRIAEETGGEILRVVDATSESTALVAHVATATQQLSETSAALRDQMRDALNAAERATRDSRRGSELAHLLDGAAQQIGNVISIIESVADQTRLLALNAAIEAARAGDSGRGFAVVAEEVRKLADQTSRATSEIGDVVGKMRSASEQVGGTLTDIALSVSTLAEVAASAAAAVDEQAAATRMIAENVTLVSGSASQVRTAVGRVATASERTRETTMRVLADASAVADRNGDLRRTVAEVTAQLLGSGATAA
jgi:methyl-accepting chemotaxis protein